MKMTKYVCGKEFSKNFKIRSVEKHSIVVPRRIITNWSFRPEVFITRYNDVCLACCNKIINFIEELQNGNQEN